MECDVPILWFTKLLKHRNIAHLEQVLGMLHVVVYNASSKLDCNSPTEPTLTNSDDLPSNEATGHPQEDSSVGGTESDSVNKNINNGFSASTDQKSVMSDITLKLPQADLQNLCSLLGCEGISDKFYTLTGELLKKLASIALTWEALYCGAFSVHHMKVDQEWKLSMFLVTYTFDYQLSFSV